MRRRVATACPSEVAPVQPDGGHSIVLTAADRLPNPTAIALRGDTVYVLSAAHITRSRPDFLVAHLNGQGAAAPQP